MLSMLARLCGTVPGLDTAVGRWLCQPLAHLARMTQHRALGHLGNSAPRLAVDEGRDEDPSRVSWTYITVSIL